MRSAMLGVAMGLLTAGCSDSLSEIAQPASPLAVVSTSASLPTGGDACETGFAVRCADAVDAALRAGDDRRAEALAWKGCTNAVHACVTTAEVLDAGRAGHQNAVAAHRLYESACSRGVRAACLPH